MDTQAKANYENVMIEVLGNADLLSAYQAILFYVQGSFRGSRNTIKHKNSESRALSFFCAAVCVGVSVHPEISE